MFEITSNNGNHPDIFRHTRNLWLQAADAPHNQINLYTGLGSLNHLINQNFIRQGINLNTDISLFSGFFICNLLLHHLKDFVLQAFRCNQKFRNLIHRFSLL